MSSKSSKDTEKMFSLDYVASSITEFKYEPDGLTFEAYYRRYEQIFQ